MPQLSLYLTEEQLSIVENGARAKDIHFKMGCVANNGSC